MLEILEKLLKNEEVKIYVNFINDRHELGFLCLTDVQTDERLSNLIYRNFINPAAKLIPNKPIFIVALRVLFPSTNIKFSLFQNLKLLFFWETFGNRFLSPFFT